MPSIFRITPILLCAGLLVVGCVSESDVSEPLPETPPAAAFFVDTSAFAAPDSGRTPGSHFREAQRRMEPVNHVVRDYLSAPALLTEQAAHADPSQERRGWRWQGTVHDPALRASFVLEGLPSKGATDWLMKVAEGEGRADTASFLLYSLSNEADRSEWEWTLFDRANKKRATLMEGSYATFDPGAARLVLSLGETQDTLAGVRIVYTVERDQHGLMLEDAASDSVAEVEWHAETRAGSVQALSYNRGNRACWDSQLQDVICPETPDSTQLELARYDR